MDFIRGGFNRTVHDTHGGGLGMIYLELLLTFMLVGALGFGGGYAVLPLIEEQLVVNHGWLTTQEFIDILTLSEMTPGPIAVNAATFSGNRIAGVFGGIVATIGVVLPSFAIVILIAYLYFKFRQLRLFQGVVEGLRPAVVALIASAGLTIFLNALFQTTDQPLLTLSNINLVNVLLFAIGFTGIRKYQLSPIKVILLCGGLGMMIYSFI